MNYIKLRKTIINVEAIETVSLESFKLKLEMKSGQYPYIEFCTER